MFQFDANRFLRAFSDLDRLELLFKDYGPKSTVIIDDSLRETATDLHDQLMGMGLVVSLVAAQRLSKIAADDEVNQQTFHSAVRDIRLRMTDELGTKFWLHLDDDEARYFTDGLGVFGKDVTDKLPKISTDLAEAGKCFGVARYTACVFHLMRAMEYCLQELGAKLGVTMSDELVWQIILDQVNKAIKSLNAKDPQTSRYSEIAAHLYAVKLAWRNEVMHPKATYTKEEAREILYHVKLFTQDLVNVL